MDNTTAPTTPTTTTTTISTEIAQPTRPRADCAKPSPLRVRTNLRAGDRLFDSQNGAAGW